MSITGSLLTYENNSDIFKKSKKRSSLLKFSNFSTNITSNITSISMDKTVASSSHFSISNGGLNEPNSNNKHHLHTNFESSYLPAKYMNSKRKHVKYNNMYSNMYPDPKIYLHLNSLWSIWYGVLLTLFQGYLAVHGAYRFLGCSLIAWKIEPVAELNLQIVLSGLVFVLLPFFFTSAVFKVGNLANDGIKLANSAKERRCSMLPHDGLEDESRGGTLRTLWIHGGPTAAFIHILIAICLLLPRLLLEARIIENGLLPRDTIWQTELDFMTVNRRNLVILSVIASPYQNNSLIESQEDEDYFNDTIFTANLNFGKNTNNLLNNISKQKEQTAMQETGKTKYLEFSNTVDVNSKKQENEHILEHDLKRSKLMSTESDILTTTLNYFMNTTYEEMDIVATYTTHTPTEVFPTELIMNNNTIMTTNSESITATPEYKGYTGRSSNFSKLNPTISKSKHESYEIIHSNYHNGKSTRKRHRKGKLSSHLVKHKNHQHYIDRTASSRLEDTQFSKVVRSEESIEQSIDLNIMDKVKFPHMNAGGKVYEHRPTSYEEVDYGHARISIYPKSSTTISTTTRDSNIHIVKPEKLPEIIPSTPLSSNSKIIEIKSNVNKKFKRAISLAEGNRVEIEPEYLISNLSVNNSSEYIAEVNKSNISLTSNDVQSVDSGNVSNLDGFAGMLQILFGIEKPIDVKVFSHPPSAEFINLLFALLVWSVRYPAVFWATTKSFATIFSIQMIAATADIIFSFVGISSLFKLQIYSQVQPIQNLGLILNASVTLALFLLSVLLILSSSMVMYLYGHGRLSVKMRDRSLITFKSNESWICFAHCASLCYILSLAVVKAPLLNDLSATYRFNLHSPTFTAALVSVMHIFLWIIIWIGLTAKRKWNFKLPPLDTYAIIGKATTQPLLIRNRGNLTNTFTAGFNNSTTVDPNSTSACDNMELKVKSDNSGKHNSNASSSNILSDAAHDSIYWPKIAPSSPKLKVTFNEVTSTSDDDNHQVMGDHEQNDGKRNSSCGISIRFTGIAGEIDDGEYATLRSTTATTVGIALSCCNETEANRTPNSNVDVLHLSEYDELPPPPPHMISSMTITNHTTSATINPVGDYANCSGVSVGRLLDDNISEEGKLLASVRDDNITYASSRDIEPPLPPPPFQPIDINSKNYSSIMLNRKSQAMPEAIVSSLSPERQDNNSAPVQDTVQSNEAYILSSSTPRCLRKGDSGVHQEVLTPRSDSTSSGTDSTSPPECAPSESSSGVHSAEEKETNVIIRPRVVCKPLVKLPPPAIQEEPYGRCTNMRMSSFVGVSSNSATLPSQRSNAEQKVDYSQHCSTMPLPFNNINYYQQQTQSAVYATSAQCMSQSQNATTGLSSFQTPQYANSRVALSGHNSLQQVDQHQQRRTPLPSPSQVTHTILPNGVRYSNPNIIRRPPYNKHMECAYSHQTFCKTAYENKGNSTISEDRDSANYSMNSDQDCFYVTTNGLH